MKSRTKLNEAFRKRISFLYYKQCLSASELGRRLNEEYGISVSKSAILYVLRKIEVPIPRDLRLLSGSGHVTFYGDQLDLLPFVSKHDLRWADDRTVSLRFSNSNKVILKRRTGAAAFGYVLGLYTAEGSKGEGGPMFSNSNRTLATKYLRMLRSFVQASIFRYEIPANGRSVISGSSRRSLPYTFLREVDYFHHEVLGL